MLSIQRCRQLADEFHDLPDDEVERRCQGMYDLARAVLDVDHRKILDFNELQLVPTDLRPDVEERAAILEFDAGLPRTEATARALRMFRELSSKATH